MGLATYGYRGDVVNSISVAAAYPGGRTFGLLPASSDRLGYRNNSFGELAGLNQGRDPRSTPGQNYMNPAQNPATSTTDTSSSNNGIMGEPVHWWVTLLVIFVIFVYASRHLGAKGEGRFGQILPSVYNLAFLTVFIVLMLTVLKVFANKFDIPGFSDLIKAV